jgi:hypothetical protein
MRINVWIVLVVLVALLAVTRLARYQHDESELLDGSGLSALAIRRFDRAEIFTLAAYNIGRFDCAKMLALAA